jgi:hypothetical protein
VFFGGKVTLLWAGGAYFFVLDRTAKYSNWGFADRQGVEISFAGWAMDSHKLHCSEVR